MSKKKLDYNQKIHAFAKECIESADVDRMKLSGLFDEFGAIKVGADLIKKMKELD